MALEGTFLKATVLHNRHAPKKHNLKYNVWYLCLRLSALPALEKLRFLSRNKPNLYSLYDRDYGDGKGRSLQEWADYIKSAYQLTLADGEVTLITMPRLLHYAFNPINTWYFHDQAGGVRAVMAEVNNTFGERHCYICRHPDQRVISPHEWLRADKVFHVSPFMQVSGTYDFRFQITDSAVNVWINHNDGGQQLLSTALLGQRENLTNTRLIGAFFRYPLLTLRVIVLIHWHALRLFLKGLRYNVKPKPPKDFIST